MNSSPNDRRTKYNKAVARGVRRKSKVTLRRINKLWKWRTRRFEYEGDMHFCNGYVMISETYLTELSKRMLYVTAAESCLEDITPQMYRQILPQKMDVKYHYVAPHLRYGGGRDALLAVYASGNAEHITLVNTNLAPPPILYGSGNDVNPNTGDVQATRQPLVGDPEHPNRYLVMPVLLRQTNLFEATRKVALIQDMLNRALGDLDEWCRAVT